MKPPFPPYRDDSRPCDRKLDTSLRIGLICGTRSSPLGPDSTSTRMRHTQRCQSAESAPPGRGTEALRLSSAAQSTCDANWPCASQELASLQSTCRAYRSTLTDSQGIPQEEVSQHKAPELPLVLGGRGQ
jgi:hypothetical protein